MNEATVEDTGSHAVASTLDGRSAWSARGWAIYLSFGLITLDGGALNLALPTIASQMHGDTAALSWVVDAYTLPLASLLLLAGSLGDRFGAADLLRIGAAGFALATAGCALSPTLGAVIAAGPCRAFSPQCCFRWCWRWWARVFRILALACRRST
jgi:MFS family permease